MKHASLLIALCVLLSLPSFGQSTTTVEKSANRITITTKKIDENGKSITETYIAEGDEPAKILEGMAIDPGTIQKVEVIRDAAPENAERLFLYRNAGDNVVIEGMLEENIAPGAEKIVIINSTKGDKECVKTIVRNAPYGNWEDHKVAYSYGNDRKSNCAALGVYVNNEPSKGGSRINSLIEKGGAQEAGLKAGDVVTKIDEFEIVDFETLHLALAHFKAGDVVTVRYTREGKNQKARVELKDWAVLPGHEWRARTDCGEPESITQEEIKVDDPSSVPNFQPLVLEDIRMFPNPTDGAFALSFNVEPGPLTVSITDINGKVIYSENHENRSGVYTRDIDLKGVPQGNYVLTVTQGEKVFTDQISKQ